jgi:hypothetical protein
MNQVFFTQRDQRGNAAASLAKATGQPKNFYKIMADKIIFPPRWNSGLLDRIFNRG